MSASPARTQMEPMDPALTREEVAAELKELVQDLRDAAQDGRMLARRYAELLTRCVDEYCIEFEKRAEAALERLKEVQ